MRVALLLASRAQDSQGIAAILGSGLFTANASAWQSSGGRDRASWPAAHVALAAAVLLAVIDLLFCLTSPYCSSGSRIG